MGLEQSEHWGERKPEGKVGQGHVGLYEPRGGNGFDFKLHWWALSKEVTPCGLCL